MKSHPELSTGEWEWHPLHSEVRRVQCELDRQKREARRQRCEQRIAAGILAVVWLTWLTLLFLQVVK